MSSQRQLLAAGHAKRANMIQTWIEQIHAEPGFNVPETPEEFEARVEAMVLHLEAGGVLPPVEVRERAEGGVYLVDGHARVEAYRRAAGRGIPVANPDDGRVYVVTIPFTGNDADRVLRTITSAEGRTLTPLQLAERYKRLQAFGWTPAQIARGTGKTPQHVGQVLTLANANSDVQRMVREGEVSATEAVRAVKKVGDKAGEVLTGHLKHAKESGKDKVTAAVVNAEAKARKAREHADLLADAQAFRLLVELGDCRVGPMGTFEVSFDVPDAEDGMPLREAVRLVMAARQSEEEITQ